MNALLLIDVQNDFCPGGALAVSEGDAVVPIINAAQKYFDLVVATQDWHPPDHGSFAANHPQRNIGDIIQWNGQTQVLWPIHCVQSTLGAALRADLDTSRLDRVIQKGQDPNLDSYSGFFDNGAVHETGLRAYLLEKGVRSVTICGLATDYCVRFSALDAVRLGFQTRLLLDACRGVELQTGDIENAVQTMRGAGVEIIESPDLEY